MIFYFIIACLCVFLVLFFALRSADGSNNVKISSKSPKQKAVKEIKDTEKKPKVSYEKIKRTSSQKNLENLEIKSMKEMDEELKQEFDAISSKKSSQGKRAMATQKTQNRDVVVEDLGEYDENSGEVRFSSDDEYYSAYDYLNEEDSEVLEEINNLSPELKSMLIGGALKKLDD